MKLQILNLSLAMLVLNGSAANAQDGASARLPEAHVAVQVVDQDGIGVADASVAVAGTVSPKPNGETLKRALTDRTGKLKTEVKSNGEIHVSAEKTGFYRTEITPAYSYRKLSANSSRAFKSGRWEPGELALQVQLKRIINPTAMFARRVNKTFPTSSDTVGFDLFAGDYVAPNGDGKIADLILKVQTVQRAQNDYDYQLIVSFAQKLDGILPFESIPRFQGSVLRSPYSAPETGFLPTWTVSRSRRPGNAEKTNLDPERHAYFFRIRTDVDSTGKIVSCNYGKIYGDFMNFTYYLNPTSNDRNVEFDPNRNLFTNLRVSEQVKDP